MAFTPVEMIIIYLHNDCGVYILYSIESYYVVYKLISNTYPTKFDGIVKPIRLQYTFRINTLLC